MFDTYPKFSMGHHSVGMCYRIVQTLPHVCVHAGGKGRGVLRGGRGRGRGRAARDKKENLNTVEIHSLLSSHFQSVDSFREYVI